jgi:hypothetical protein
MSSLANQKRPDKRRRPMHAASDEMGQLLGITGYSKEYSSNDQREVH